MAVLDVEIKDQTRAGKIKVIRSLGDIKKSAKDAGDSVEKFDDALDDAGRTASKTGKKVEDSASKFDKLKESAGKAKQGFSGLKGIIGGIGAALTAGQVIQYADAWTEATNKLRLVTDSSEELSDTQEKLFQLSQDTRSSLSGTVDLYSKLARTTESLGLSQTDLLSITTTVNQAIQASGASSQSAEAALTQLGQGLAAGALRGEELNSVMEQTPRLARAIADGMGLSIAQLREFGAQGKLTAETVTSALLSQGDVVRSEFLQTEQTVGTAFVGLENSLSKAVGRINEAIGATGLLTAGINAVSQALDQGTGGRSTRGEAVKQFTGPGTPFAGNPFVNAYANFLLNRQEQQNTADILNDPLRNKNNFSGEDDFERLAAQRDARQARIDRAAEGERLRAQANQATIDDLFSSNIPGEDLDLDFETDLDDLKIDLQSFFDEMAADELFSEEMLRNSQALAASSKEKFAIDQKLFSQQLKERGLTDTQIAQLLKGREAIFAHTEALKNQTQELETQEAALAAGVSILSSLNSDLGNFAKVGTDLFTAFTSGNPAQQITAVAGGFTFLVDTFFGLDDSAEKAEQAVANLNRELERADRSAQNVIEDLFDQDISAGRERIFSVFEDLFNRLNTEPMVNISPTASGVGPIEGATYDDLPETQAEAVRTIFDFLASFDATGVSDTLEDFDDGFSRSQKTLIAAIESSFTSFDEFEQVFLQTFGDTSSFNEIASAFFDTSDAFDHLRESANRATDATRGLTDEQERATRLQFAAEEQAARLELSERARLAGGDAFLQRQGLDTFLSTYSSIQRSRDLALSRGGTTTSTSPGTTGTTGAASTSSSASASVEITAADIENWMDLIDGAVIDGSTPLEIDFSDGGTHELEITRREIDSYDDLMFGDAYDGSIPLVIDFSGKTDRELKIFKKPIHSYDELMFGTAYDGRQRLVIDFSGRTDRELKIFKKPIHSYDELFFGTAYDGRTPLVFNFGEGGTHQLNITKFKLDEWSDIFTGPLISLNTSEQGFNPLRYNFGQEGLVNITGQYSLTADDLFRIDASEGIDFDFAFLQGFDRVNVTPAKFAIADLIEIDASRMIDLDLSSVINVDASNLKEAIARAVQEAIDDRDFDSPYQGTSDAQMRATFAMGRA